jgi:hypothetical protein
MNSKCSSNKRDVYSFEACRQLAIALTTIYCSLVHVIIAKVMLLSFLLGNKQNSIQILL